MMTETAIEKLDELSFERELTDAELEIVWSTTEDADPHQRFRAYRILSDYASDSDVEILIAKSKIEKYWIPRSAIYAVLLDLERQEVDCFLEDRFRSDPNPNARYKLGMLMREAGNANVLRTCADMESRQPRWKYSKWEAQYLLGEISQSEFQTKLKRMLRNGKNWRYIEIYLERAGLPIPPREEWQKMREALASNQ